MQINLTRSAVDAESERRYSGPRLLSKIVNGDRPDDSDWWPTRPKRSNPDTRMHEPAILLYLWIAQHANERLENCFSTVFEFSSGHPARVDKGVIKSFIAAGYITPDNRSGRLLFRLTPAGESWYRQQSA